MTARARTVFCGVLVSASSGLAAYLAATGRGPHVPWWLTLALCTVACCFLLVPPRPFAIRSPAKAILLVVLTILALQAFVLGLRACNEISVAT